MDEWSLDVDYESGRTLLWTQMDSVIPDVEKYTITVTTSPQPQSSATVPPSTPATTTTTSETEDDKVEEGSCRREHTHVITFNFG